MNNIAKMLHAIEHAGEPSETGHVMPPIAAGLAPGGVVVQIVVEGLVARQRALDADHDGAWSEIPASDAVFTSEALDAGRSVELRIFDGDSGDWIFTRSFSKS